MGWAADAVQDRAPGTRPRARSAPTRIRTSGGAARSAAPRGSSAPCSGHRARRSASCSSRSGTTNDPSRTGRSTSCPRAAPNVRCHGTAAADFPGWLGRNGPDAQRLHQPELERWTSGSDATYRDETGHFRPLVGTAPARPRPRLRNRPLGGPPQHHRQRESPVRRPTAPRGEPMKLPITIHQARLGSTEFKVIRPARPLVRAVLIDHDRHLDTYLDQDAAQRIGALWKLATSSPRSLVHLPMRGNRPPPTNCQKTALGSLISSCCTTRSNSRLHAGRRYEDGSARAVRRP